MPNYLFLKKKLFNSLLPSVTIFKNYKAKFTAALGKCVHTHSLYSVDEFCMCTDNLKYFCKMNVVLYTVNLYMYTGLFISPSVISDPCGTVAGMVTPKRSMSTEGKTLQVSVLPYRCSLCAPLVTRQMSIL